jgi:hypothetical protein
MGNSAELEWICEPRKTGTRYKTCKSFICRVTGQASFANLQYTKSLRGRILWAALVFEGSNQVTRPFGFIHSAHLHFPVMNFEYMDAAAQEHTSRNLKKKRTHD